MKTKPSRSSSMNNWPRDTFVRQNPNMHLPFSLSRRKTESYDLYKITDESMDIRSAISTHYPSYLTSLQTSEGPQYFPSSTFGGDTITCTSNRETSIKQLSKHDMDSSSPPSCFLDFVTLRQLFKR